MGLFESLNKELIAVVQLLSHVGLCTAWTAQASLSFTISLSSLRFMFIESLTIPISDTLFSFCLQSFLASDKLVLENDNMGIIDFDHLLFSVIKIKMDFFRGNLSLHFPGGFPSKMCKMLFCFFWSCNSFYFLCLKANRKQTLILLYMNKLLPAMLETWLWSLGWKDPLEKEMATHFSTLDWRMPWMEESQATVNGIADSCTRPSISIFFGHTYQAQLYSLCVWVLKIKISSIKKCVKCLDACCHKAVQI